MSERSKGAGEELRTSLPCARGSCMRSVTRTLAGLARRGLNEQGGRVCSEPEKGSRAFFVAQTRRARAPLLVLRVQSTRSLSLARPESSGGEEDGGSGVWAMRTGVGSIDDEAPLGASGGHWRVSERVRAAARSKRAGSKRARAGGGQTRTGEAAKIGSAHEFTRAPLLFPEPQAGVSDPFVSVVRDTDRGREGLSPCVSNALLPSSDGQPEGASVDFIDEDDEWRPISLLARGPPISCCPHATVSRSSEICCTISWRDIPDDRTSSTAEAIKGIQRRAPEAYGAAQLRRESPFDGATTSCCTRGSLSQGATSPCV